jgi:hypothetical protein
MTTSNAVDTRSSAFQDHNFNRLPARIAGVITSPRATLTAVALEPRWAGVLILSFLVTTLCSAALLETEVGRLALLDQWDRTAAAFGQNVDDAQYSALEDASSNGTAYAVISSLASGPLLTFAVASVLFLVFRTALSGAAATFRQVVAVVAHAGVILALRQVIAAPVNYARESLASPMTMTVFLPMLDEASPIARFFSIVDLFVVWWLAVLAVGMSVLSGRPTRTLFVMFIGAYIVLALLMVLAMAVTGGTA